MSIGLRNTFFIVLGFLIIWFLYIERNILTPFILAGIFAYIFTPVVDFISCRIKLPRSLSIIIIYAVIMAVLIFSGVIIARRILNESTELEDYITFFIHGARLQINYLPDWLQPIALGALTSLQRSSLLSPSSVFVFFPQAISHIISFFIFLFSGFYFLKEGKDFIEKFLLFIPKNYKVETEIILRKINSAFGAYLRGQLLLVFIVSTILFLALTILGIRFALILAIFSGFAEIVPIIGPITAGAIASLVVFATGNNVFNLTAMSAAIIVAGIYFVVRQFQDYFINPLVLGKITKLHPLVVLFAVIAGGHIWGWLGLILAVPIAAVIRIFLKFTLDKINENYLLEKEINPKKVPGRK